MFIPKRCPRCKDISGWREVYNPFLTNSLEKLVIALKGYNRDHYPERASVKHENVRTPRAKPPAGHKKSTPPDDGKRERNDSFLTILLFLFFGDVLIDIINIRVGLFYVLLNT